MAGKRSAGLLLFRVRDGELEVLLAHMGGPFWARKDEHAWSIPKGEYPPDEDPLTAARREFTEELGAPPPDGPVLELGEVRQSGGKSVTVWAVEGEFDPAAAVSNTFELEWPPHSGRMQTFPEVDRVAWFDLETARVKVVAAQAAFLDRLAESTA
ncbi:MAG TPA: NUDIX domain-containing protein [Jatrophihabitantaceae bacterium]|nr:NUDIX domain-containing protein [Jatrophihabitantaceae bacterium]